MLFRLEVNRLNPNALQKEIINYISDINSSKRVLLVEAPPGTGKTYTAIASSLEFLKVRKDIANNRKALILTFSKNAKAQLDKQLSELEQDKSLCNRIEITNFHSFFQKYVWAYSKYLGLKNDLFIVSPEQRKQQLKEKLGFINWDELGKKQEPKLIEWIDNILENSHDLASYSGKGIIKDYLKDKQTIKESIIDLNKQGFLSFSDIGFYMNELIDKSPQLLKTLQYKYPLVILDEYQDSSSLQDIIVKKIIGKYNKAIFFADPKQMIYDWRGASPNRLTELKNHFKDDLIEKELTENMRFKDSIQLKEFFSETRKGNECEVVSSDDLKIIPIKLKHMKYHKQEMNANKNIIYYSILKVLKDDLKRENFNNCSLGILCRCNDLVEYIQNKLREECHIWLKDISNNKEEHNMVGVFFEFLEFINNYTKEDFDDILCRYIFYFIFCVIYETKIASFKKDSINDITIVKLRNAKKPIIKYIYSEIITYKVTGNYVKALKHIIINLKNYECSINKDTYGLLMSMLNLKNLNAENVTKVFLQYQHKRAYRILKGIYILTMHQSKGREFDIVYVIREPNMKAQDNLFYVAVTRTKRRLVLFEQKYI